MKKNECQHSNEILELNETYKDQGQKIAKQLCGQSRKPVFIQLDCLPNGKLNVFNYGNGLESLKVMIGLAGSFLANDRPWLERKMASASDPEIRFDLEAGEKIGIWTRVRANDLSEKISWDAPFCLKSSRGRTKIWHPERNMFPYNSGFSTRTSIVTFIHEETVYLQRFFTPLATPETIAKGQRMAYRLLFFCEGGQEPELIGGLWISRPGFKIYLAKDSIVGLVSPHTVGDF